MDCFSLSSLKSQPLSAVAYCSQSLLEKENTMQGSSFLSTIRMTIFLISCACVIFYCCFFLLSSRILSRLRSFSSIAIAFEKFYSLNTPFSSTTR